jgi:hypothetical protein
VLAKNDTYNLMLAKAFIQINQRLLSLEVLTILVLAGPAQPHHPEYKQSRQQSKK